MNPSTVIIVCSALALGGAAAAEGAGNLLKNGDFEAPLQADGTIPGWEKNSALEQQECGLDSSETHGGTHALRIRSTRRTDEPAILSQDVTIEPGRTYTLTLWAKRDSFVYGTEFDVLLFAGDKQVGRQAASFRNTSWRPLNMVFESATANRARVRLKTPNKGEWRITVGRTLWVDDVTLIPIDPQTHIHLPGTASAHLQAHVTPPAEGHYYLWIRLSGAAGSRIVLEAGEIIDTVSCYSNAARTWLRPVLPEFTLPGGPQAIRLTAESADTQIHEAILTLDPFWTPPDAPAFLDPTDALRAQRTAGFTPVPRAQLELTVQGNLPPGRWGLSQGIPFPKGVLQQADQAALGNRPCQTETLTTWPDGSVKWLLLSTLVQDNEPLRLEYGTEVRQIHPENAPTVSVTRNTDCIAVDTGPLQFEIPLDGSALLRHVGTDTRRVSRITALTNDRFSSTNDTPDIRIEEQGPLRCVIRIGSQLRDHEGQGLLDTIVRVIAFAGAQHLEMEHTFLLRDDRVSVDLESLILRLQTESARADLHLDAPHRDPIDLAAGAVTLQAELAAPQDNRCTYPFSVRQADQDVTAGVQAPGIITLSNPGRLTVAVRDFCQNAPKSLHVSADHLDVALVGGPLRFYQGMAKTHHLLLSFAASDGPLACFSERPLLLASPDWYCNSKAFNAWPLPTQPQAWNGYETCVDTTTQYWQTRLAEAAAKAEHAGMLHYGDATYSSGGNNLETALGEGAMTQFFRSGRREFFDLADVMIRHFVDIDIDHSHTNAGLIWVHGPHTRTRSDAGNAGINGHSWYNGTAYYGLFMGSRRILETAPAVGDYYAARPFPLQPYIHYWRQIAWKLMCLMQAYDLTGNVRFLEAALEDVKVTAYQRDHLVHLWPYMYAVGLKSLRHYWDVTADPQARELYLQLADGFMRLRNRPDDTVNGEWPKAEGMLLGNFPNDRSCCFYSEWAHATWMAGDPRFARAAGDDLLWQIAFGVTDPTLLWGSADLLRAMRDMGMAETTERAVLPFVVMSPAAADSPLARLDRPAIAFQVLAANDAPFSITLYKGAYRKYTNDYQGTARLFAPDGTLLDRKTVQTSGLRTYHFAVPADGHTGIYTLLVSIEDPWRWTLDQIDLTLAAGNHLLKVRPRYDREFMDAFCLAPAGSYFPADGTPPPPDALILQAEDGRLPPDAAVLTITGALGGKAVRLLDPKPEASLEIPFTIPQAGTYRFFARVWKGYADLLNVAVDDQPEVLCKQTHDMDANPYPAWSITTSLGPDAVVPVWNPGNRSVSTYSDEHLHPSPALP